jgi:hypothetical protein
VPNINYIEILKKAWQTTWKNRFLWWFGLIIALSSPGGLNFNFNTGKNEKIDETTVQKAADFIVQNMHWIIIGAIALVAFVIVLVIAGTFARSGLIKSIDSIFKNKPAGFKAGMKEGKKYFWKLIMLGFSIFFMTFASIVILAIPVIFLLASGVYIAGALLGIFALFILIFIIILASFLKIFGNFYIVLGELTIWNAMEKAYALLQKNFLTSIIMGLLFMPLGLAFMMLVIVVLIALAIIFIPIGLVLYFTAGTSGAVIAACIGAIFFLVIFLALRSVYETFAQSAWYLFFLEIAKPKVEEKVEEEILEKKEEVLPVPDPVKTIEAEK